MQTTEFRELYNIVEEEESIMEPDIPDEQKIKNALGRVRNKLSNRDYDFTPTEINAVKYALEDVGELYLYAGTSAGFDTSGLTDATVREYVSRGLKARTQAAKLGILL